jgi:chemosensory pili system protein ChpA (sensor histidine kinase/response regulator)
MADNRNYAALDWLVHEISETLKEARQSLESYVENPSDTSRIRFCLTHIHQVHGSLQMVEFYGAAMLASEMEQLTQSMIAGRVSNATEAQEVLMRSILQFPIYLEQVKQTRRDNPLIVLPLLNDLRAVRGESLLTDTKLFMPNLAPAKKVSGARLPVTQDNVQFQAMALKLRQMYQYAASGFIRGVNTDENLAYLQKVFSRMQKLTHGTARFALWDICLALHEALEMDALEISVAVKNLLRQLDKEIKLLAVHGVKALTSFTNDELIKNLLYYVARAGKHSPGFSPESHLHRIYDNYQLEQALLEGKEAGNSQANNNMIAAPDAEAMNSVVTALKDELNLVKNSLDICLAGGDHRQSVNDSLPIIKRVADTLAVLGLGNLRKKLLQQGSNLKQTVEAGQSLTNDELLGAASQIIGIENALESLLESSRGFEDSDSESEITLTRAKESVLRESRNGLEHAKDAIVEFIASKWNPEHLEPVPATLREIRGGLEIMPLPRPARILGACARYIEEQLLGNEKQIDNQTPPAWSSLQTLADAIVSVEYYLERLASGVRKEENDLLLSVAEESVASLGYAVAKVSRNDVVSERTTAPETEIVSSENIEEDSEHLSAAYGALLQPEVEEVNETDSAEILENIYAQQTEPNTTVAEIEIPTTPITEVGINPLAEEKSVAAASTGGGVINRNNNEDIDDEIIEIFVEEAAEVTETIAEYFPRWAEDQNDKESLIEFRRAFHTLKGSGRMVGANEIGELAWSIENMLNRVIDHTIDAGPVHISIIEKVRGLLPDMIVAFRDNQPNPHAALAETYRQQALSLSQGIIPADIEIDDVSVGLIEPTNIDDEILNEGTEVSDEDLTFESTREEMAEEIDLSMDVSSDEDILLDESEKIYEPVLLEKNDTDTLIEDKADAELIQEDDLPLMQVDEDEQAKPLADTAGNSFDFDDPDAQLWEIFGAEAEGHLQVVAEFVAHMEAVAPLYEPPSEQIQRALHTLKGSAHMADITQVAELAAPLERLLKELRSYHVNIDEDVLQLLRDTVDYTQAALIQLSQGESVSIPRLHQFIARVNELRELHITPLVRQEEMAENGKRQVDPELLAVFMAEEMNLLLDADKIIAQWQSTPNNREILQPMVDELRRLTQAAAHAYLPPMAELGEKIRTIYDAAIAGHLVCTSSVCTSLNAAHSALLDMVDAIAAGQNLIGIPEGINEVLDEILSNEVVTLTALSDDAHYHHGLHSDTEVAQGSDEEIDYKAVTETSAESESDDSSEDEYAIEEEIELAPVADTYRAKELEDADEDDQQSEEILKSLQTASLSDFAMKAPVPVTEEVAEEVIAEDEDFDPEIVEIFIDEAVELLDDLDRALHDWEDDWNNLDAMEDMKRSLHTFKGGARLAGLAYLGNLSHDFETKIIELDANQQLDQNFFQQLHQYQDHMHSGVARARARLNGETPEPVAPMPANKPTANVEVVPDIAPTTHFNKPTIVVDNTRHSIPETAADEISGDEQELPMSDGSEDKPNVLAFAPRSKPEASPANFSNLPDFITMPSAAQAHLAARRSGPQEVVKVSAELLEELVNLAGETSISRGRMEQQVTDLSGAIGEMDATIQRLQEQLRRLDIETEAQVLFRQEQMAQHEEFDPLEMDRYSQLQQLSRSLIESASDLMDLKYTLSDKTRDTETLLLQQSRINTDLQEGLMRSRMVPFSRLVPRLRRIVRQAATELGKEVDFDLDNVEGEMDRTVLERMVAPLEHMLRNAVDHGIEMPADRAASGKSANGRILLSLAREGSEVVLRLKDDGRGINLQRVREKAVERGLMAADAKLSDEDVIQFILHAGFSTAEKVTQISGRGVGMDVVASEIKQLGGNMLINSIWGQGTEFEIRLPFTVSVNRALMIQIGEDLYAVPLNTIEGIVRVSPFELEHYYQDPTAVFDYAGENYLVRYLGGLLDSDTKPKLDGQGLPLPVILVRSADQTVALQVDRLLGSREIVVKTLGMQFGSVRGVSGATIMGDGSVVVILDLHAVIREQRALNLQLVPMDLPSLSAPAAEEDTSEKTIMVVDDSVTVRKVTSRFLEREGFRVITAKDGAEALQVLQDQIPDLMLLDIEMPRMDGFEVAKNVRSSSRMKGLPIIMITSRTGDKHRERAFSLGVNKYMGKPYQEDLLLSNIRELLKQQVH